MGNKRAHVPAETARLHYEERHCPVNGNPSSAEATEGRRRTALTVKGTTKHTKWTKEISRTTKDKVSRVLFFASQFPGLSIVEGSLLVSSSIRPGVEMRIVWFQMAKSSPFGLRMTVRALRSDTLFMVSVTKT